MRDRPLNRVPHDVTLMSINAPLPADMVAAAARRCRDTGYRTDLVDAVVRRDELEWNLLVDLVLRFSTEPGAAALGRRTHSVEQVRELMARAGGRSSARIVNCLHEGLLREFLADETDPWAAVAFVARASGAIRGAAVLRIVELLERVPDGEDREAALKAAARAILEAGSNNGWPMLVEPLLTVTNASLLRRIASNLPNDVRLLKHVLEHSGLRDIPERARQVTELENRIARLEAIPATLNPEIEIAVDLVDVVSDIPSGLAWDAFFEMLAADRHSPVGAAVATAVDALRPAV